MDTHQDIMRLIPKSYVIMGLDDLLKQLKSRVVSPDQEGNKEGKGLNDDVILDQKTPQAEKRQINCRAFTMTRVLMATKTLHCLDRQGVYCGDCILRQGEVKTGF